MKRLVFVYGTLRKNFHNNYLLSKANYLGEAKTKPEFTMYSLGGFPAVTPDGTTEISGEVYEIVDEDTSWNINSLEGYTGERGNERNWYDTIDIETPFGKAEMFIFKNNINQPIINSGIWK